MKDKGFLIGSAGALGNVLKIRPPLVFSREHADLFLTAFGEIVEDIYGTRFLTATTLRAIAERALDEWDIPAAQLELISISENTVFRVDTRYR